MSRYPDPQPPRQPEADADLDLDRVPAPPAHQRRRPLPASAVLVAILATFGGALLDSARAQEVRSVPRVSAWVALDSVRLDGRPVAELRLGVTNRDDTTVFLTALDLSGGGTGSQHLGLRRPLTPGQVDALQLPVDLFCPPGIRPPPFRLTLQLARANGGPGAGGTVVAVPQARLRLPGGLCQEGDRQLPQAYQVAAETRVVTATTDSLTLALSGLPASATEVFSVQADGWLLPLVPTTTPVRSGRTTLRLGVPQPRCDDAGTRRVVPTGLQVVMATGDGSGVQEAYAPVGILLARWLMASRQQACPR